MNQHYALELWEPAAPAFYSASKLYIGDKENLLKAASSMEQSDPESRTAKAIREYFSGNREATHNIAYKEIPVLKPVRVLAQSKMTVPERTWEHLNVWDFPYRMRLDAAEVQQILIKYECRYHRCIKAEITNLCYKVTGQELFGNILFVQEDSSDEKEVLIQKMNDPEALIFGRICDEIFADG